MYPYFRVRVRTQALIFDFVTRNEAHVRTGGFARKGKLESRSLGYHNFIKKLEPALIMDC
jgi:hypothetical protein